MNQKKSKTSNDIIKIGIDLGTTNSAVAVNYNDSIEIVKNAYGSEHTPSVFGVDRSGNKVIGQKAHEQLYRSASQKGLKNNKAEVKRLMGTSEVTHFESLDVDMTPEEVSAEILKSLREDVIRKYSDLDAIAAVITVPAYFSTQQAEATKRAGELAGFQYVTLLQEPIAAAMAYGYENKTDKNWLVYDLGGGTFDVALMSSKDGMLTVLGHNGNNFLGGKDFDWLIVDKIIKPAILEKYSLTDFNRNNPEFASVFARLKSEAEAAKVQLSVAEQASIDIEDIISEDDYGEEVYISLDITRREYEDLIKDEVNQTIELATKTIEESGVDKDSIDSVLLVGAPTQTPYIKQSLKDKLEIEVDASVDPLTVIARGACMYGLSQRIPQKVLNENQPVDKHDKAVELHYDPMTSDDEQTITGSINTLKDTEDNYYVQIQSDSGTYTSSKIKLKRGTFNDTIKVDKGKTTHYWLYLFDDSGNQIPISPNSFTITHGLTASGTPIPETIGVIYAQRVAGESGLVDTCEPFFVKNSILPLEHEEIYKTVRSVKKGEDNSLDITVYQGESLNPEHNKDLTKLTIDGNDIPHDLPEDTEINISISIDESRTVTVEAYIPLIEKTLNVRADTYEQEVVAEDLEKDLSTQRSRINEIEPNVSPEEKESLHSKTETVTNNLKNAENDIDERKKAERDIRELKEQLDQIEETVKLPQLEESFKTDIQDAETLLEEVEDGDEKQYAAKQLQTLRQEGEEAIEQNEKSTLIRVNEQIKELAIQILLLDPAVWMEQLEQIKSRRQELTNTTDADFYIQKAQQATNPLDFDELKYSVRNLLRLLPEKSYEEVVSASSEITKK